MTPPGGRARLPRPRPREHFWYRRAVGQPGPAVKALPSQEAERICAVLRRALQRLCPPELLPEREDLVQAALLKLLEIRDRAEQSKPVPASYLWQVAYTTAMDELRRRRRRQNVREPHTEEAGESPSPGPTCAPPSPAACKRFRRTGARP